jgi:cyclomaltodextrinase / maltogenic alpha-amylase / neopullulanase
MKYRTLQITAIVVLLLSVFSCSKKIEDNPFFDGKSSLSSICVVENDTTIVLIRDYFPMIGQVDNVSSLDYQVVPLSKERDTIALVKNATLPLLSTIKVESSGEVGYIVVKQVNKDFDYSNKVPFITTISCNGEKDIFTVKANDSQVDYIVLWQNTILPPSFYSQKSDDELEINIPKNAASFERSFIRVYSANSFGIGNDLLIPLERGKVLSDVSLLKKNDCQSWIMYQVFLDRFYNGNKSNDRRLNRKDVLPQVDYYGGDIAGVTRILRDGYFDSLSVNLLWISPITQNPETPWGLNKDPYTKFSGYHGYWPLYLTKLDPRYGTPQELEELIDEVHKRGDNIILDYVSNHAHIESPTLKEHPDWVTPSHTPDGRLNLELWDEFRLTTWFDKHIPSLDLEREDVNEPLTDSALVWMKRYKFDGFRHDATKHIPEVFWRKLTKKIKEQITDREIFQIGETYGSAPLISSYIKSGMLDCQFDFNVYDQFIWSTSEQGGSFENLANTLNESLNSYGYHNLMGYITGNHDRARYVSIVGGDLFLNEDYKLAGWKRKIGISDSTAYNKLSMLHTFMFTIPGVPCIYYGDEYGQPGANDPDNRRWAQFEPKNNREKRVYDNLKILTKERKNTMALMYGDYYELAKEKDFLAYVRIYMGEYVVVALNKSYSVVKRTLKLPVGLKHSGESTIEVELNPNTSYIYNSLNK